MELGVVRYFKRRLQSTGASVILSLEGTAEVFLSPLNVILLPHVDF
jgi:hypothetical protein